MNTPIRIGVVGVVGVPARYGGLETMAHHLVLQLSQEFDLQIYCSKKNYQKHERPKTWEGADLIYLPLKANGAQSVLYDIISLFHAIWTCDAILVFGVSGCLILPFLKLISNKKILVNIDGLEWRRPKWGKFAKAYLKLAERLSAIFADGIISDNTAIQDYVRDVYKRESNMIAYGGDHAVFEAITPASKNEYSFLNKNYAVKACRIEPENNIEMILEAYSQFSDMDLVILGNWVDSEFGRNLRARYSDYPHIHMLDFIRDQKLLNIIRSNAYVYLHGHSAGGTNPSLVEAMNLGLPVLAFDVVFNRNTTFQAAKYFSSASELLDHLNDLNPTSNRELGERMKVLAETHYTWEVICQQYADAVISSIQADLIPSMST